MRRISLLLGLQCLLSAAGAQEPPVPSIVPASAVLYYRTELALTDSQVAKLEALAGAQTAALSKATAAYLRAEADLIDAARGEDLVLRRSALEKRSKLAIDGEITRLKSEKEARAVLTASQRTALSALEARPQNVARTRAQAGLWQGVVGPTPVAFLAEPRTDSGEIRVSVIPNYADIYIDGEKRGVGRKYLQLPVGTYELKLHAVGCVAVIVPITVEKGPPSVVSHTLSCK